MSRCLIAYMAMGNVGRAVDVYFFIALGIGRCFAKPDGIGVDALQKQIVALMLWVLLPLMLLAVGLSLRWDTNWNSQLQGVIPVVVVELILVPLLMWGMVKLFGSASLKTTTTLMLDSMLPATLFGFVICARQKLDSYAYAMAFTVTSVLALVTVPIWYKILL
jgi:predicted permease